MKPLHFDPEAQFDPSPALAQALSGHGAGCRCALHGRRLFTGGLLAAGAALAMPAWAANEGVVVGERSKLAGIVPANQVEAAAAQQYQQMQQEAAQQKALLPDNHPQVVRLRAIAKRLIPFINSPNYYSTPRAAGWQWEINILNSKQINAFCMPGGKIAFYMGILKELQINDDEVAQIMGHEIAHALREHARERMGKSAATRGAIEIGAALFGLGDLARMGANMGGQLLTMTFGRDDESEADKIGLDMAARAGYDPQAAITLWQKMGAASKGSPPQWLSTHPSNATRIRDLQAVMPAVQPLYARAEKPRQRFEPPAKG